MKVHSLINGLLLICILFAIIQSAGAVGTPPSTPIPLSPGTSSESGQQTNTNTPTLQWNSVSGADYYALAISKYPYGTSNIVYNPQQIYGTSITVPGNVLVPGERYRWNMQAHNSAGWSAISSTLYFATRPITTVTTSTPTPQQTPFAPTPYSPGTGYEPGEQISPLTPTLQWSSVSGADYYALAISKYPYGTSNIIYNPQQVYGTSITVPGNVLVPGEKYRWNMQAHNSAGWSAISSTLYFKTAPPSAAQQPAQQLSSPPAVPIPLLLGTSSEPGQQINTLTPTLTWTNVFTYGTAQENFQAHTEEYYYAIEIRKYPYNSNDIVYHADMIVHGPDIIVPAGKLVPGEKYRWSVKAHNIAGWSSLSSPLYFRTESPQTVRLTLYVHEGSTSGSVLQGARVFGYDGSGNSFDTTTSSSGSVVIDGAPGTWSFTASKTGYDTNSWSSYITISKRQDGCLTKTPVVSSPVQTQVQLTLYMHDGSTTGNALPGVTVIGQDGSGVSFNQVTNNIGVVTISGNPGTWQFSASKAGYDPRSWPSDIVVSKNQDGYLTTSTPTQNDQPKLVTDKATDVTGISATLHGQIENAKTGETYQVCFRYDKDGLKPTTPKIEVTQNNPSFSYILTGLTPGTAYSFRAVSINSPDPIDAVNVELFNTISPSDTTSCPINNQRPTVNWPDNGWFYPLRSPEGNELSKKEKNTNTDFDTPNPSDDPGYHDKRHLGYDLMCDGRTITCPELKYSVHAIGDGTVVDVSHHTGWGGDDSVKPNLIVIKHKAADGTIFYALYGHLQNIPTNLKTVSKGQFIGNTLKVNEEHLHFSLDDGSTSAAAQRYAGYTASIDKHAGDYGFYDPQIFLKNHNPESEGASPPPLILPKTSPSQTEQATQSESKPLDSSTVVEQETAVSGQSTKQKEESPIENTENALSTEPVLKPAPNPIQDTLSKISTWFTQFLYSGSTSKKGGDSSIDKTIGSETLAEEPAKNIQKTQSIENTVSTSTTTPFPQADSTTSTKKLTTPAISYRPPARPYPLSPGTDYEPGEKIYTRTPTLTWKPVDQAEYYSLAISKSPYGSDNIIYSQQQISGTSITVPDNILKPGETYRWNMQAYNSAGGSEISWILYFTLNG